MATKSKPKAVTPVQFLYGYQNPSGEMVIPAKFEQTNPFQNGFAGAKQNGKWGVIREDGSWAFEPKFEFLGRIENGHALIRTGRLWGAADLDGNEVLPPKFDEVISAGKTAATVKEGGELRILSYKGQALFENAVHAGSWRNGITPLCVDGRWGLALESGQWLLQPEKPAIYDFSEGLAAFEDGGLAGYLDTNGKVAIAPKFEAGYDFSEGLARVRQNGKHGYINSKGEIVLPCEWADPVQINFSGTTEAETQFKQGFAKTARSEDGLLIAGFLDKTGQWHDERPPLKPALTSVRVETAEWKNQQESEELGPQFTAKLKKFREKFAKALAKDEASAGKEIKKLLAQTASAKKLNVIIYDMNDYSVVAHADDTTAAIEAGRLKALAQAFEGGIMDEPKSAKGIQTLNNFHAELAHEILEWYAGLWQENGGDKLKIPAFVQVEDGDYSLDLKTKKKSDSF